MHFQIGMRRKMREDFAHPGLSPLSFFISSNCQTSVLDFGISLDDAGRFSNGTDDQRRERTQASTSAMSAVGSNLATTLP